MKILLTGAAGFIGSHVAALLRAHEHDVLGVDSYEPQVHGACPPYPPGAQSVAEFLASAEVPEVDAVVHLAARVGVMQSQYEVAPYVNANVGETAALLEAYLVGKRCRRFIVASSMSIYGEGLYWLRDAHASAAVVHGGLDRDVVRGWDAFRWVHEDRPVCGTVTPQQTPESKPPEPASVYALTKLDQERYTRLLGAAYGVPTVALRFFNVFGEGQALANPYTGVLAQFACRVLNGKAPLVYEDGKQTRDFIHVSDVARAVVAAVETAGLDGVFNVCTGSPTSVGGLAMLWCDIARARGLADVQPEVTETYRDGDVRHCIGDPTALERATGWRAEVALPDGLARTATWILENHFNIEVPEDKSAAASDALRRHGLER